MTTGPPAPHAWPRRPPRSLPQPSVLDHPGRTDAVGTLPETGRIPMPEELDEIRQRLDTLESRMDSESGLRAMMDLDQASLTARLDAQDRLLRALSVTKSDHTSRLTRLEDGLTRLEGRTTSLEEGQHRLEG